MKNRSALFLYFTAIIILILCGVTPIYSQLEISSAIIEATLDSLDETISQKSQFTEVQKKEVEKLRERITYGDRDEQQEVLWMLFEHYRRIQTDSALHYLEEIERTTDKSNKTLQARIYINRADIFGVTGMYASAMEQLRQVKVDELERSTKVRYYHTQRTINGWLTDYASTPLLKEHYKKITNAYRDSILLIEEPGISRNIVLADKQLVKGKADEALSISLADISKATDESRRYIFSNIADAYKQKGDQLSYTYYLALTAIDDIRAGIKEYRALPALARQLYEEGDIERAYTYLTCSMEDANSCKARLRSVETSNIFPIIDKAYKAQKDAQHHTSQILTIVMVCASLLLAGLLLMLRWQNKKLTNARRRLLESNNHLNKTNIALEKADKVKEDYIAFYLGKCRGYLEALKHYRQDLLKLAKNKQNEALLKRLNSSDTLEKEQQRFYKDFDEAFLNIHPHFVEGFNALLDDNKHIALKRGELMNTELRIFALIRLGVTDTQAIARFLDYSVATVYNYRSRLRNQSKFDKDEFEERVKKL